MEGAGVVMTLALSCATLSRIALTLRITAVRHLNRDHDAASVVAKGPVLHLFGDEIGIWNENAGPLGGLNLGRTNADFAHIALLAAYDHQVTNLDGSLRQENQTGHEIIDHALQAETDTDRERPG